VNNRSPWLLALAIISIVVVSVALPACRGVGFLSSAQSGSGSSGSARAIPGEYTDIYSGISDKLDAFLRTVEPCGAGSKFKPVYAAELLPANAHAANQFAIPAYYSGTIAYIDALRSLGVQGVKIAANYPILASDFPNSAAYLDYYRRVVAELRKRNMTVLVAVQNLLADSDFTSLKISHAGVTWDKYRKTKREIVETVIRQLKPDYLTIANEPSTEAMATGLRESVADFTATVQYVLAGLDRGGVLVGAGAGSWNDAAYVRALAQNTSIDYFDLHVYPADFFPQALTFADIVRNSGKRLIIGEAWTYKVRSSELGNLGNMAAQAAVFGRDAFSFWESLDSRFLEALVSLAKCKGYEFVSPFWSRYFFGYLDYETLPKGLGYREITRLSNEKATREFSTGRATATGQAYQRLIAGVRQP
jgi:hypothetical protein